MKVKLFNYYTVVLISGKENQERCSWYIDVLCCNRSDMEEAPSSPMGLRFRSRCVSVEFLQSAAASFTAPSLLMWQSPKSNLIMCFVFY